MSHLRDARHDPCPRGLDVGAYVLDALDDDDFIAFDLHLPACGHCRAEVAWLQVVADVLPVAAPQLLAPPALKGRLMAVVASEAQLLAAAGPQADRLAAPRRRSARGWLSTLSLRPALAVAASCALVAVGLAGGVLVSGGDSVPETRTLAAWAEGPAQAELVVTGNQAKLRLAGLQNPPSGKVYQVWFQTEDGTLPTSTLFTVRSDGRANVAIEEPIDGVKKVLVTAEKAGGAEAPTSHVVIAASPA